MAELRQTQPHGQVERSLPGQVICSGVEIEREREREREGEKRMRERETERRKEEIGGEEEEVKKSVGYCSVV